jgi:hypothetical protein
MHHDMKQAHDDLIQELGQTFEIERADAIAGRAKGQRNTKEGTLTFPSETDIQPGDTLRSVATQQALIVTEVDSYVINDHIIYLRVRAETAVQRAQRQQPSTGPTFNFNGPVQGSIVGTQQAATLLNTSAERIDALHVDDAAKAALGQLVAEFTDLLAQVPVEQAKEAATAAKRLEQATLDLEKDEPDAEQVQFSMDSLTKAAEKLAKFVPPILTVSTQIAEMVRAFLPEAT